MNCGWATLKNGALLQSADLAGYELLITTDKNLIPQPRIFMDAKLPSLLWDKQTGQCKNPEPHAHRRRS